MSMVHYVVAGAGLGFAAFLVMLETSDMGNIIWRNGRFAPENVWGYIKHPFYSTTLWNPPLWVSNWLVTTGVGAMAGAGLSCLV